LVTKKVKLIKHFSLSIPLKEGLFALIVYVDDIVVMGNDDMEIQNLKHSLTNEFEIKDLAV
jgi:hypothetical protein